MLLLTLLTMTSWAEPPATEKSEVTKATPVGHKHKKHRTENARSQEDIDGRDLSKYTDEGLTTLINLFRACIARNEARDPENLRHRLAYQQKRGGKTANGQPYATLTESEFLNIIEDETAEMERDLKDAEAELAKRGHKCGCKARG